MNMAPEAQIKITRLYLKMMAGIIFTEKEALPQDYIIAYAEKICDDIGESSNGYNILKMMVKMDIIKVSATLHGDNFYTHTLPKTIQVNFHAANHYRTA